MLIRHAEKAEPEDAETGVKKSGEDDKHSLSVEGWQRAGALVSLFAPLRRELPEPRLARPASMIAEFADAPGSEEKKSKREEQTLLPLGKVLGFKPDFSFGKGQEKEAAEKARESDGPVLIAWEHHKLCELAKAIVDDPQIPNKWPKDRYDIVFVFRLGANAVYTFEQVPQLLLPGDADKPIEKTNPLLALFQ